MRAHSDPVALNYTFYEIVTSSDSAPREVRSLRNRCLNPGVFVYHLENWLDSFPSRQVSWNLDWSDSGLLLEGD